MCAAQYAPRGSFHVLERGDSLAEADVHEGVAILEDVVRTARRVFGLQHPFFVGYREDLERARMRLAGDESREARA